MFFCPWSWSDLPWRVSWLYFWSRPPPISHWPPRDSTWESIKHQDTGSAGSFQDPSTKLTNMVACLVQVASSWPIFGSRCERTSPRRWQTFSRATCEQLLWPMSGSFPFRFGAWNVEKLPSHRTGYAQTYPCAHRAGNEACLLIALFSHSLRCACAPYVQNLSTLCVVRRHASGLWENLLKQKKNQ